MGRTEVVGREPELALLRGCLEDATEGNPRVVVCLGEPGIGKTRLAEELLAQARDAGVRGAWGAGVEGAGTPPYWPWRQVLRGLANTVDVAATAGAQRLTADLAGIAPDVFPGAPEAPRGASADQRFRQFDALALLLAHLTRDDPLVIVLDDVHWADSASLLLLQHLTRGLRHERLLVVVNARDTDSAGGALLASLLREPVTRQLHLHGLAAPAVARQLAGVLGREAGEAEVAQVHAVTGGNPFFVSELGAALGNGATGTGAPRVTWTLREAIRTRVDRLSEEAAGVLRAASVAGQECSATVVAAMTGLPVLRCVALLDEAAAAGLVAATPTGAGHRFAHALVREAVEAGLATADRVRLHRRAAQALEHLHGEALGPHLFDLARHWAVAAVEGDRLTAAGWVRRAGQEAIRRNAYEEGVRLFRLALDLGAAELADTERGPLLAELGTVLELTGDLLGGLAACREAAAVAQDLGWAELAAQAALVTEPTYFLPDADLAIRRLCEQALGLLGDGCPPLRARVLARLAEVCVVLGDDEAARTASGEALVLAEEAGQQDVLVAVLKASQEVFSGPDALEERADLAERMLAVAGVPPSPDVALAGHLARVDAALERGDLARVARELDAAAGCARQAQGRLARWLLLRGQSVLAQAQARFADARRLAEEAHDTVAPLGHPSAPVVWSGFLSTTAHHVGHDGASVTAIGLGGEPGDGALEFPTAGVIRTLAPAVVLADLGRVREAASLYRSLGPVAEWRPTAHAQLFTYAFGIRLAMLLGASDDVAVLHDRLVPYRGHHVVSGVCSIAYFGPVELWLGVAAAHLDLLDDAIADLEHAAKACAVSGAAGFHAEAQLELGRVLARRAGPGDVSRARRLVAESERQAEALGMPPVAARAASSLKEIDDASPGLPLTRREREVAELVAQGLTNRQIADRLFLSERTAQNHVQHILEKLQLPNRSQIAVLISSLR